MYLTQSLHRTLQQHPDRVLTVFGDRVRTVAESADRIARFAGALAELGVRRGDRVGILALNSDRYYEYLYAVPWLGAAVNPVNIRWSPAEISYSLRESDTRVLLVDDAFAALIPQLRQEFPGLTTVIFCGDGPTPDAALNYETLVAEHEPVADTRTGGDELAGVFYTGGTTGHPKGVMLSHDNMIISALGSCAVGDFVTPYGTVLHVAPMFHLADIAMWVAGNLVNASHVFVPMFTPGGVLQAIGTHGVTNMLLVPTMIQLLVDDPAVADFDLSGVRTVTYGASPISEAVLARARKVFPMAGFTQAYGMTELAPVATLLGPAEHDDPVLRRSAGRATPHVEVRIVDADDNEVPRGEVGEVVVRGDNVMLGYWNRPEDTAAAVRDGWMHTGDGGRMDEHGYVFIVDRLKDMIITGGENVYSAEVENALAAHAAVASCAVIGVPDDEWGERVHAVVVLLPGAQATEAELRAHCKSLIAGYKAPRTVEFAAALPVSGAGKILKRELRRKYWEPDASQVS
ncbi:putative fatty-acid--CoA ligase [Nocardia brasiliensis NBRC 14402]|uniref:long-chain-fatty-acid--CoA ligase n=1 Tax=Nocardia brasiliensis TaxID=37326 RepID=UPI0002E1A2AF|nr:long-chain-fatty-acid--CoA ligase [Nocardia brasiliensis]AVL26406.1 fatty-acid--CoA ligase [Nocardia brasiliensis]GAJ86386.1 putative fatty-acid--CoA ligase [Nocardia brasiliensis NBRC 14402]SUB55340.1 Long-chain-fatty-acid--CoA ligase [Nocardia brasiliensis]